MLGGFEYLREAITAWLTGRHFRFQPTLSSALDNARTQEWHYTKETITQPQDLTRVIIVKAVALSSYECLLYFKATIASNNFANNVANTTSDCNEKLSTMTTVSSKTLSMKICLPTNASYGSSPIYLPGATQRQVKDQLSSQLMNLFPSISDAPSLAFISQETVLMICQMLQGRDVAKFSLTSKRNHQIISRNDWLWELLLHSVFNPKFIKSASKSWQAAYKDLYLQYRERERMMRADSSGSRGFFLTPPSWSPDYEVEPLSPLWLPPLRLGLRGSEDAANYAMGFPPSSRSTLDTWY